MPPKRNKLAKPPPVMSWLKASPTLVFAVISDALRIVFQWFWFFGPAFTAATCTIKWSSTFSTYSGGLLGPKAAALVCGSGAVGTGVLAFGPMAAFGTVMAMVVGFAGWLAIWLYLLITNARIFKANGLWIGLGLLGSIIPFINSLPFLTATVWRLYHVQIKAEKKAFKKWQKEQAAGLAYERNLQAQYTQMQAMERAQVEIEVAANEERFIEQVANEEAEIPEKRQEAA